MALTPKSLSIAIRVFSTSAGAPIPLSTMSAPAPANARAHPRPIPLVEPVTTAVFPFRILTSISCWLHAFILSRPDSSFGPARDVGLAVGGSHARPCPTRGSGRPVCESRTPTRELVGQLLVPTHGATVAAL